MGRRNRACAPCKQRRMKCDETHPQCQQCLKAGRVCPGPVQGPVIVDMTKSIAERVRQPHHRTRKRMQPRASDIFQNPSSHQVMMQLLVAQYLAYFCGSFGGRGKPWMLRQYGDVTVADLPLQAAALAHYATEVGQPDALVKSHNIYVTALAKQRSLVGQALNGRWSQDSLALQTISSNVILAYFEATQGTTTDAYELHIHAAANFLHRMGPKNCKSGVLNQLFFTVRSQLVRVELNIPKPR